MSLLDEAQPELEQLAQANRAFTDVYPGDRAGRQPVHTYYEGAQHFRAETARNLGALALQSLDEHGADALALARGVGFLSPAALARLGARDLAALAQQRARDGAAFRQREPEAWLALTVHERVRAKLAREPIEDLRIDFEDGFGARPDAEEDAAALAAAREVARRMAADLLPPFIGIRIKCFGEETRRRGIRTLELFLDTLLAATAGQARRLPENFVVTLPKVTLAEQPRVLVRLLDLLEQRHRLPPGTLRLEIMIEVTQALMSADGRSPLPGFLAACRERCVGAHLGVYDFTTSCGITAAYQGMDHPMCDLARGLMLLAYAGTGIFLSDGSTNLLPVGPAPAVHAGWRRSHDLIRSSLRGGFYQGWDLHPAQLPARYATCYAFFLEGLGAACQRLRGFVEKAEATPDSEVLDDVATGQALLNHVLRALSCGAIDMEDAAATGLGPQELDLRSFAKILQGRRR
jgi:hypothetical protein